MVCCFALEVLGRGGLLREVLEEEEIELRDEVVGFVPMEGKALLVCASCWLRMLL